MHMEGRKALFVFLSLPLLLLAGCGGTGPAEPPAEKPTAQPAEQAPEPFTVEVKEISKHGNAMLAVTFEEMKAHGLEVGDTITVTVGDNTFDMPVGTGYTDVDTGGMLCRFDTEDGVVSLAVNMGSFAAETGMGVKETVEEEPGYTWTLTVPRVTLALKEKKGYLDEYNVRNLTRTNAREDYPELTEEEFANFRAVSATGIGEGILYRSSTPVEPALGRNEYAMAATEAAGIKTVLNLDDSVETMESYPAYPGSYYSRCALINPEMNYDFGSEEFSRKVKDCLLFMTENEAPYLIHCKEGKDRTGILCALLECFMGASYEEVAADYMLTYRNYYGVTREDAAYGVILKNNLEKTLCGIFGIGSLAGADLSAQAAAYFRSLGLTDGQLESLRAVLRS